MKQTVDYRNKKSLMYKLRKKRFNIFKEFLSKIRSLEQKDELTILYAGGTLIYWETFNYTELDHITILNLTIDEMSTYGKINFAEGNALNLYQFKENEFDVVFSNSVIEHVGDYSRQQKMRDEILRVGKYSFIQTPNFYFPIEPHYRFPFFFLLSKAAKKYLLKTYHLRTRTKRKVPLDRKSTDAEMNNIHLLKRKDIINLFPSNVLICERFFGFTKSFITHSKL